MPIEHWIIRVKRFLFFLIEAKITSYYTRSAHSLPKSKSDELTRVINFCSARSYLLPRSVSVRINYRTNINEFSRIAARVTRYCGIWRRRERGRVFASIWRGIWSVGPAGEETRERERVNAGVREKKSKKLIEFYHGSVLPLRVHVAACVRRDPRDTCVFTIGCRYLRRHFRCDGVINGNWIEPQSTPSQGYRPTEIYSPDTI